MPRFATLPPLSLYVHLPWCERKCPYCDFNSHPLTGDLPEGDYVSALLADLEQELPDVWGRGLCSIFFGGGTPSLFSPESLDRLLSGVRSLLPWQPDIEITLEANPGSAEAGRFRGFRDAGINRLSIGVQSFHDRHLRSLGRIHDRQQALAAAQTARLAGFDDFNLDLMYGLPGQTPAEALADIELAIDQRPSHLSCYQLTLEPNTQFHHQPPRLPDEDAVWEMQNRIEERLQADGFVQYEVSAHARGGRRCRHNLNYWRFGDYLGIGAGAHSKITFPERIVRSVKVKHPRRYLRLAATAERIGARHTVGEDELPFEFMLNVLRLREPTSAAHYQQRTGLSLASLIDRLETAARDGLLELNNGSIAATERGFRFLNDLQQRFLPTP